MKKAALIIATLLLAGCQTVNSALDSVIPAGSPAATPQPQPAPTPSAPQTAMVTPAAPIGATSLTGQTAETLHALWGDPSLKRKDLGSELWQYSGKGCTLLVYLYPASSGAMTVNHAEAVPGGTGENAISDCARAAGKPPIKPIS